MILTGKCKEDFEKWLYGEKVTTLANKDFISKKVYTTTHFYNLPLSMQYGCYVEFFDSIGIDITIEKDFVHTGAEVYYWNVIQSEDMNCFEMTRQEARTKAIEKATETYNNTEDERRRKL